MRSFDRNPRLHAALLAAIDERIERAENLPITVGGESFALWSFSAPDTFGIASSVLRVPEDLLVLGAYLFQGFPEDAATTVDHLTRARSWLAALPIGVDLGEVTIDFAVWRLTDALDGVASFVTRAEVRDALDTVALALIERNDFERARSRERVASLIARLNNELSEQWRRTKRVGDELHAHLRALETADRAIEVGLDRRAPAELADRSVFGANGVNVPRAWRESDAMQRWLVARLRSSG